MFLTLFSFLYCLKHYFIRHVLKTYLRRVTKLGKEVKVGVIGSFPITGVNFSFFTIQGGILDDLSVCVVLRFDLGSFFLFLFLYAFSTYSLYVLHRIFYVLLTFLVKDNRGNFSTRGIKKPLYYYSVLYSVHNSFSKTKSLL